MLLPLYSPSLEVLKSLRLTWLCSLLLLAPLACDAGLFTGPKWRPVTPEEQDMSTPLVDPDVGAEILFKEVIVENRDRTIEVPKDIRGGDHTMVYISYYLRFKIFDDRGAELMSSYNIDVDEDTSLNGFAVRVIQPDGSKIVSDSDDLIERDIVIVDNDRKRRFTLPISGLVPGSIVDVQWKETYRGFIHNKFFMVSDIVPIHKSRLEVFPDPRYPSRFYYHNTTPMRNMGQGYLETVMENVPGVPDEPFRPSPMSLKSWVFMSYAMNSEDLATENSWEAHCNYLWDRVRFHVRDAGRGVKRMAAQLTQGVEDRDEKLLRLYNFCRNEIANLNATNSGYTSADMQEMDEKSNLADVLKNRRGFAYQITLLFAALAHEAGFEVNLATCNDRTYVDWNITHAKYYMAPILYATIRNGETWEYFNPGIPNLACGMIYHGNEGTPAVFGDPGKANIVLTPESPAEFSQIIRSGDFTLDEEGTLSGEGSFEYSGHCAFTAREHYAAMTPEARIDNFKEEIAGLVPSSDVSNVVFENLGDPEKNLIIRFSLNCTAYADATDERIFLQPGVFQKAEDPMFTNETRHTGIRFPYFWETNDKVTIRFPDGFELEDGAAPSCVVNTAQLAHVVQLALSRNSPTLIYTRRMKISARSFAVSVYDRVKAIFDAIHQEDQHVVSLRRKAEEPEAVPQTDASAADQ